MIQTGTVRKLGCGFLLVFAVADVDIIYLLIEI